MGRLVDIDAVIKVVDRHTKDGSEVVLDNDITCILEEVPIAYDVEEVVAEIEHDLPFIEADDGGGVFVNRRKTIDAIRKGGVESHEKSMRDTIQRICFDDWADSEV